MDCGPPPVLVNGSVTTQNGSEDGSIATYDCNFKHAFTVESSKERICKSSGNWSDEIIECGECGKRIV